VYNPPVTTNLIKIDGGVKALEEEGFTGIKDNCSEAGDRKGNKLSNYRHHRLGYHCYVALSKGE